MGAMKIYRDEDTDLRALAEKTVAVIGYGNQGRAQALNLRDSGVRVIVGNVDDESAKRARRDGLRCCPSRRRRPGATCCSCSSPTRSSARSTRSPSGRTAAGQGAGLRARLQHPLRLDQAAAEGGRDHGGAAHDRAQRAPALPGWRRFPAYMAVEQDASGHAWDTALALAKGIGATRAGGIETTFAQETEIDLFMEQVFAAIDRRCCCRSTCW